MSNRRPLGKDIKPKAKPVTVPGSVARKEAEATEASYRKSLRPDVIKYLNAHIGTPVHVDEMVETIGRRRESIQAVMGYLIKEGILNIKILSGGNSWMYRGLHEDAIKVAQALPIGAPIEVGVPAKGSTRMYEEMGTDSQGRRILKDEEGRLWAATEL